MKFEWDDNKNKANIEKHGIAFTDVCEIFNAPMLVLEDSRYQYDEVRYIGMGTVKRRILVIIFTRPHIQTIRIISARKANQREQNKFKHAL